MRNTAVLSRILFLIGCFWGRIYSLTLNPPQQYRLHLSAPALTYFAAALSNLLNTGR